MGFIHIHICMCVWYLLLNSGVYVNNSSLSKKAISYLSVQWGGGRGGGPGRLHFN